jgi:hypothetical protein
MQVEAAAAADTIKELLGDQVVLAAAAAEIILDLLVQFENLVQQTQAEVVELIQLLSPPAAPDLEHLVPVVPVSLSSLTHHKTPLLVL